MRTFFQKTYGFWIFTRILFAILFIISLLTIFFEEDLKRMEELIINLLCFIYTIALAVLSVKELSKSPKPQWLRIIIGVFSVLIALGLTGVIFFVGTPRASRVFLMIFPVWIFLFGIWDIMRVDRKVEEEEYI